MLACSCILLMGLAGWACERAEPPPDITDPAELLFLGYTYKQVNCARCHGPQGQGGMQAPSLQDVFAKYGEDSVATIIAEGKGEGKDGMPPFESLLTEEEMDLLLDFLRRLQSR